MKKPGQGSIGSEINQLLDGSWTKVSDLPAVDIHNSAMVSSITKNHKDSMCQSFLLGLPSRYVCCPRQYWNYGSNAKHRPP